MTVSITFERNLDFKKVDARLNIGEGPDAAPESDIRVKWARLAMRYIRQISEAKTLEFNPHVEDTGATLTFTGSGDWDDFDDEYFDEDEDNFDRMSGHFKFEQNAENAIGFELDTFDAYKRLGGLATPSVELAGTVHQLLLRARSRAAKAA